MDPTPELYVESTEGLAEFAALMGVYAVIEIGFAILMIIAYWKIFTKAGQPGWAAIIPFYNVYVMLQIIGRPGWWLLLFFVPVVNVIIWIIMMIELAKSFGRGGGFALGLIVFPFIWMLILGFGADSYKRPAGISPA